MWKKYTYAKPNYSIAIASRVLVFAVLSCLLYIPCYFYMIRIHRANIIDSYQSNLDNGIQMLDSSINSVIALESLILNDSTYNELFYTYADIDDQTLNRLRSIIRTHTVIPYSFISNFGLIQNEHILLTKEHIYYEREHITSGSYIRYGKDYFSESSGNHCFLPASQFAFGSSQEYSAVALKYRLLRNKDLCLFTLYPAEELLALFVDDPFFDSNCISLYSGNTLLLSHGNQPRQDFELLTQSSNTRIDFRVELYLSDSYIENDLVHFKRLAHMFLVLVMAALCFWCVIFTLRITHPFHSIAKILYETGSLNKKSPQHASISILVNGLQNMGAQLSDYKQLISEQKKANQIHVLEKALYRGLHSDNDYDYFSEVFSDFPSNWQLAFLQYIPDDQAMTLDSLQLLITNSINQKLDNAIVLTYDHDILLLFYPVHGSSTLDTKLQSIQELVEKQYSVSFSFTISHVYNHYSHLSEALQQLEYDTLTFPANLNHDFPFSMHQIQRIYNALQNGNAQAAISTLQCASFSESSRKNLFAAKYSYQTIVYTLLRLKLENNVLDIAIPKFNPNDLKGLFETELPQCFSQIAERLNQHHTNQIKNLDLDIGAFINKNLCNQQLCIAMVTDYFRISAPTLQKRMVSIYGKTFSAYVEEMRMEKAQLLLQNPNLTIQEIAETIGYTNTNSFYKAYKRYWGQSPRGDSQRSRHFKI